MNIIKGRYCDLDETDLYWSNSDGWTLIQNATVFSNQEISFFNKPIETVSICHLNDEGELLNERYV